MGKSVLPSVWDLLRKIVLALGWSEGFDSKAKSTEGKRKTWLFVSEETKVVLKIAINTSNFEEKDFHEKINNKNSTGKLQNLSIHGKTTIYVLDSLNVYLSNLRNFNRIIYIYIYALPSYLSNICADVTKCFQTSLKSNTAQYIKYVTTKTTGFYNHSLTTWRILTSSDKRTCLVSCLCGSNPSCRCRAALKFNGLTHLTFMNTNWFLTFGLNFQGCIHSLLVAIYLGSKMRSSI